MVYLTTTAIRAQVRPDGSLAPFEWKTFNLMLDAGVHPDAQLKEAKRILRQIGKQVRRVEFERPGN